MCNHYITYCTPAWGGANKTTLLSLEKVQRCVLKVMLSKPDHFATKDLYQSCKALTVRQLFVFCSVLRKHRATSFDAQYMLNKRRFDKICQIELRHKASSNRQHYYLRPVLYNAINNKMNIIYPLTSHQCKKKLSNWLH